MTETTKTRTWGLSERGALAYLFWPTFVAVLLSIANNPLL